MPNIHRASVTVRVPATSANLGPGFDCLGMALDLWNTLSVTVGEGPRVEVSGEGAGRLSPDARNLIYRSALSLFERAGVQAPPMTLRCENTIPLSRGLGSSSSAIVAGLVAANAVLGDPLTQQQVLDLAVELEGHPDNVTPALLGGCQICVMDGQKACTSSVPVPEGLRCVLLIPEFTMPTREARAVLPRVVPMKDAVYNVGRAALLVNALATGRLDLLRVATEDRLHQIPRQQVFRAMRYIFDGALKGGALGVFLSGAGSTVLALTKGHEMTVAYEMAEAARQANLPSDVRIAEPTTRGAHLVEAGG